MDFESAKQQLLVLLQNVLSKHDFFSSTQAIHRFEISISTINLLSWLAIQSSNERFYWSDQQSSFEMAGIGIADLQQGCEADIQSKLSFDDRVRYYGGVCFDAQKMSDEWKSFGVKTYVLPLIECVIREKKCFVCVNVVDRSSCEQAIKMLGDCVYQPEYQISLPKIDFQQHFPNKEEWSQKVNVILKEQQLGHIEKVVLSRRTDVQFSAVLNAAGLLKKLSELAAALNRFYFQFTKDCAFFGASPEHLFRRQGQILSTVAIAGTRPRFHDERDYNIQQELLRNIKEQTEHAFVVSWIKKRLSRLSTDIKFSDKPAILTLNHSYHLYTPFDVVLKEGVCDKNLIDALHPTPAVAGLPKNNAIKMIQELEPFSRGWFSGLVMCIGNNTTDAIVAIRSALVYGNMMQVYAGAGIVEGSNPSLEWDEVDNKIHNMRTILEQL